MMGEEVSCGTCDQQFTRGTISNHLAAKHPDIVSCDCPICVGENEQHSKHRCDICSINFCQKFKLLSHNQVVHGGLKPTGRHKKTYECRVCQQVFFTLRAMHIHVGQAHDMKDVLQQEYQQFPDVPSKTNATTLVDSTDLQSTHVIHIGQGEHTQYLPKLSEASLNAVIKELILYEMGSDLPYKCILCGRCFGKSKYIKLHIRRSHVKDENQPYRCKICGSGFVRLTEFRKHTRSHSDFRPYKCKFCSKAFKQQANLKEHYFVHSDAKQYQCYICGRSFRQRGALTSHVVGHDTLKPFKCMFCGRGFTTRGELSRHMKKYDKDNLMSNKSYSCHMCLEAFPHFPLLLKHIDQHNPEKPFQCQVCLEAFSNFVTLYFHKLKHGHFLETEILQPGDEVASDLQATVRKVKRDIKRMKSSQVEESQAQEQPVYLSNTDDVNLLQNPGESTIEVIIEDLDQNAVVKAGIQPEHDELLSIAQQLTELSSIAEKGSILKEEDEIVKNMLDADAEVLANLNKQTTDHKWDRPSTSYDRSSVQDYLREQPTEITIQKTDDSRIEFNAVTTVEDDLKQIQAIEDGQVEIQMDIPQVSESSVATNIEELAQLIAQNSEEGEQSNVLAYQNDDGSVIYVCLPGKGDEASAILENQILETEVPQENIEVAELAENTMETAEIYTEMYENTEKEVVDATENIPLVPEAAEEYAVEDTGHEKTEMIVEETGTEILEESHVEVPVDADNVAEINVSAMSETEQVEMTEVENEGSIAEGLNEEIANQMDNDDISQDKVVEYDAKTFIREEFLDVDYQQTMELTEMEGNSKYVFVKEGKYFICIQCNSKISMNNLRSHMKRHVSHKSRQFPCEYCPKRFITGNELKRHVKIHKGERDHVCKYCGKGFIQAGQLSEHVRVHTGEKPYKCQDCDAVFVTSSQCKQHWRRIHGEKSYPCNQCEKSFKSGPDLTRHKGQMHSSIPKKIKQEQEDEPEEGAEHVCHVCGQAYAKNESLMTHLYQHAMENVEFRCSDCDKTFRSKESLNAHKKAKHEGHEHVCKHCGEAFAWKKSLVRHMQTKHGGPEYGKGETKPKVEYKCNICEKVFSSNMSLAYHMGSKHVE